MRAIRMDVFSINTYSYLAFLPKCKKKLPDKHRRYVGRKRHEVGEVLKKLPNAQDSRVSAPFHQGSSFIKFRGLFNHFQGLYL